MDKNKCPVCEHGLRRYELVSANYNKVIYVCFHCVRVYTYSYTQFTEVKGESIFI